MVIIGQLLMYQQIPIHYSCDAQAIHFEVRMSSNEPKLMLKCQPFCNSYYIYLYDTTLMACESWKVMLLNNMDIEKI
jgi:hypothetical protein